MVKRSGLFVLECWDDLCPGFKPTAKLNGSSENSRLLNTCIRLVFIEL